MTISITTRTTRGEQRHFVCETDTIEAGLEAVNSIAATEDSLLRVHLFDQTSAIVLPPEAFDGQPVNKPITNLKKEWEAILQKPVDWESVQRQYLVSRNKRHYSRHEAYIARLEEAICTVEQHLSRLPDPAYQQSVQARLREQLTIALAQYNRQLVVATNRRELILDQFVRLQD